MLADKEVARDCEDCLGLSIFLSFLCPLIRYLPKKFRSLPQGASVSVDARSALVSVLASTPTPVF